jgi:hypothetical protein
MPRPSITAGLITSLALAAGVQVSSLPAFPDDTTRGGSLDAGEAPPVQECRTAATAATTRSRGTGFSAETTTACQYDKATNQSTCTNKYADSVGTSTTTVSVTTFASLADAIDEIKVIPPRRRSLRTDTTATGARGSTTSSLVNTYDRQNRLVQEVGESSGGGTFMTTYSSSDDAGRPTAGKTVTRGNINSLTLSYDDAARTMTTTTDTGMQKLVCTLTFDVNGNPAATSCKGPGGMTTGSTTTTTATEKICR